MLRTKCACPVLLVVFLVFLPEALSGHMPGRRALGLARGCCQWIFHLFRIATQYAAATRRVHKNGRPVQKLHPAILPAGRPRRELGNDREHSREESSKMGESGRFTVRTCFEIGCRVPKGATVDLPSSVFTDRFASHCWTSQQWHPFSKHVLTRRPAAAHQPGKPMSTITQQSSICLQRTSTGSAATKPGSPARAFRRTPP